MSDQTNPAPAPPLAIGLPNGVDADAVRTRMTAMIGAGTQPLVAQKLAIDAEVQQIMHNARKKKLAEEAAKNAAKAASKAASKAAAKNADKAAEGKEAAK